MIAAIAGRVAKLYVAESKGVYQPSWTIDQVGARIDAIRDTREPLAFGLHGHVEHIMYSFGDGHQRRMT